MEPKEEERFVPLRREYEISNTRNVETSRNYKLIDQTINSQDTENTRHRNGIEVDGVGCPPPVLSFGDANVGHQLQIYLNQRGILNPTPIQMQAISCLRSGRDVIGISPTGSGKTLAYLLPLISFIRDTEVEGRDAKGLIIVPTRELMQQIAEVAEELLHYSHATENAEMRSFGQQHHSYSGYPLPSGSDQRSIQTGVENKHQNLGGQFAWESWGTTTRNTYPNEHISGVFRHCHSTVNGPATGMSSNSWFDSPNSSRQEPKPKGVVKICGGVSMSEQITTLQNMAASIIIATPGRLIDLTEKGFITHEDTCFVVLDECDKMLDMGMEEQLRKVIAQITVAHNKRQFSLWSATLPDSLERLARSAVIDPITIYVGVRDFVGSNITQTVLFMHTYQKKETLLKVLRSTPYPPVIVFACTKEGVDEITEFLIEEQFHVCGIHSDKEQHYRFSAMSAFRRGKVDILVATDLASRGLDIPAVTQVINYDLPDNIEDYIHRCGRTGRYGRDGLATSFLTLTCKIAIELKELLELSQMPVPKQLEDTKQFGGRILITEFGDRPCF